MGDEEDDDKPQLAGDPSEDARFQFFEDYVLRAMKLKNDKWAKLINVDENSILIFEYFDKGDQDKLVFTLNSAGAIQVCICINYYIII